VSIILGFPLGSNYLSIQHSDILNVRIVDVIFDPRILANTAHTYAMRPIAVDVLYQDVGRVWLWTEAVIANVNPRVADSKSVNIVRVPAVCVFGEVLGFC